MASLNRPTRICCFFKSRSSENILCSSWHRLIICPVHSVTAEARDTREHRAEAAARGGGATLATSVFSAPEAGDRGSLEVVGLSPRGRDVVGLASLAVVGRTLTSMGLSMNNVINIIYSSIDTVSLYLQSVSE